MRTGLALPTTTDRLTRVTRIDDAALGVITLGALHGAGAYHNATAHASRGFRPRRSDRRPRRTVPFGMDQAVVPRRFGSRMNSESSRAPSSPLGRRIIIPISNIA